MDTNDAGLSVWSRWLELETLAARFPPEVFAQMPWDFRRPGPYDARLRALEAHIAGHKPLLVQGLSHPVERVRRRAMELLALYEG